VLCVHTFIGVARFFLAQHTKTGKNIPWVPHKQTNNKQTLSKFIQIREFTEYSAVVEMASESFIISKKLGVETRAN
jgi:hypothetical protein